METGFRKYRDKGAYHWEQVSRSLRRHNAFVAARYRLVLDLLGEPDSRTVLDVGCGDGVVTYLLALGGGRVVGVDAAREGLALGRWMLDQRLGSRSAQALLVQAGAEQLPFKNNTFDAAVATEVLEHVTNPEGLLAEMHRVLRPSGVGVVTVPFRLAYHPLDKEHVREYFPEELEEMLKGLEARTVSVGVSHPIIWKEIYERRSGGRAVHRRLVNGLSILGLNPFRFSPRTGRWQHCSLVFGRFVKDGAADSPELE